MPPNFLFRCLEPRGLEYRTTILSFWGGMSDKFAEEDEVDKREVLVGGVISQFPNIISSFYKIMSTSWVSHAYSVREMSCSPPLPTIHLPRFPRLPPERPKHPTKYRNTSGKVRYNISL